MTRKLTAVDLGVALSRAVLVGTEIHTQVMKMQSNEERVLLHIKPVEGVDEFEDQRQRAALAMTYINSNFPMLHAGLETVDSRAARKRGASGAFVIVTGKGK